MSKYILLIAKNNENMHRIATLDEWNTLMGPDEQQDYTKITITNDPPQYDVFEENAIIEDMKDLVLNIDLDTLTVEAKWTIVKVSDRTKESRVNGHNASMIRNYQDALTKFLNQFKEQYFHVAKTKDGEKCYEILMDMELFYREFNDKNLAYPMVVPVNELIRMDAPDIIDPNDPKQQQYLRIPKYLELDGFAVQQLMFEYKKRIKQAYHDFSKHIKEEYITDYKELVQYHKANRPQ